MKNASKIILFLLMLVTILPACKKDEKRVLYTGGEAPVLTADRTVLDVSYNNRDAAAINLSWTNPDYKFNTGVGSMDVTYLLEIDTSGANFTNPKRKTVSVSRDLSVSFTQSEINDFLLNQLELAADIPHNIEMRLTSTLTGSVGAAIPLFSNVLKYTITPYSIPPKVTPPPSGELFLVGNATPGGWDNPVPDPSQKFTQVSPTLYEITVLLSAGNSYLFLPVNGSWDTKYGFEGSNNTNDPLGDNLKVGGGDIKAPVDAGNYKIQVNFQTGKFKLIKL